MDYGIWRKKPCIMRQTLGPQLHRWMQGQILRKKQSTWDHRNIDIMEGLLKHVWNLWRIIYIYI